MNILILSATENKNNMSLKTAANKRGHQCEIVSPDDIIINYLANGKAKIFVKEQKLKNNYFDAIIPRLGKGFNYGCHILRHLENFTNVFSTATADGLEAASDKLRSTIYLVKNNLPVPKTTTVQTPDNFKFLINTVGGLPAICKNTTGSQGAGVYIFNDELQSSVALKNYRKEKKKVLLQQFIETNKDDKKKNDIRLWVVGNRVVAAFKRLSTDNDFRSNFSISKEGEKVAITPLEHSLAVNAAKALGLHCAGVDIARDANNNFKPCILEVNGNASLTGITKVTGIDIPLEIIKFVESEVSKKKAPSNNTASTVMNVYQISDTIENHTGATTKVSSTGGNTLPALKASSKKGSYFRLREESLEEMKAKLAASDRLDDENAKKWNNPFSRPS